MSIVLFYEFYFFSIFKIHSPFPFTRTIMFLREIEEKRRNQKALMSSCTQTTTINTFFFGVDHSPHSKPCAIASIYNKWDPTILIVPIAVFSSQVEIQNLYFRHINEKQFLCVDFSKLIYFNCSQWPVL